MGMCVDEQGDYLGNEPLGDLRGRVALVRQVIRGCLPGEVTANLSSLGDLVLRPAVRDDAPWLSNLRGSCEEALIECGGAAAVLLVENGFARHAVNGVLGHEPAITAGSLSRVERGLLHGVLALLSARLDVPISVGACSAERQAPASGSVVIEASLQLRGGTGRAWVCASVEFLAQILANQSPTSEKPSATICLELARTRVPASQLAEANAGDVVVFDEVDARPAMEPWPVGIRTGDTLVQAALRPDGVLTSPAVEEPGSVAHDKRRTACASTQSDQATTKPSPLEGWAEIRAEIGTFQGGSLARLLCGAPLDGGRGSSTLLRMADTPWAEGEVVALDGAFAVRIKRKLVG
jgi:hypothetical protein